MGVEIFSKQQFELAIGGFPNTCQGLKDGEYTYTVNLCNHAFIELRSSISSTGFSRDCGDDSIRAWIVDKNGMPLGRTKTQAYVTRRPGWQKRLSKMLGQLAELGKWIKPCPTCGKLLILATKDDKVYVFCTVDSENRTNKDHVRHVQLIAVDKATGKQVDLPTQPKQENHGNCPVCLIPLRKVEIKKGKNTGKFALTCPAKDTNGNYCNHLFKVL